MKKFLPIALIFCILFSASCGEISYADVQNLGTVYENEHWVVGGDDENPKQEGMQFYEDVKSGKPATLRFTELGCGTGNVTSRIVFDGEKMIATYISNAPQTPGDGYGEYTQWKLSGNTLTLSNPIKTRNMGDNPKYIL